MVKIEIDDRVWNAYRVKWALDDVTEHNEVVRKLEQKCWRYQSRVL